MSVASHCINNEWKVGEGETLAAIDPSTGEPSWQGHAANAGEVDRAVLAAREAFNEWRHTSLDERLDLVRSFAEKLKHHEAEMIDAICVSTGKPKWEAATEVGGMVGKIDLSIEAYFERRGQQTLEIGDAKAITRYQPHGVLGVLGPFNLPGHLPNGHIVPALIAGNTVVFKPSEQTPLVGQRMVEAWSEAGLPPGVVNLVQGGRDTGIALSQHDGLDGLLFTGSSGAGLALSRTYAEHPGRILALEMGGNNPLIVDAANLADLDAAVYLTILSAYITSGQRCTCARRLLVPRSDAAKQFVDKLQTAIAKIQVGLPFEDPQPFYGPVISAQAAQRVLDAQQQLANSGGEVIVASEQVGECLALLSPGLVDVTGIDSVADAEVFGPLLQLRFVDNIEDAIAHANRTKYGLSAALFSDDRDRYEQFLKHIRAGVVNWNRQTTGASGRLPFGGVGHSGNHRPSGYYAADYCSYPVASLEVGHLAMPAKRLPGT